MTPQIFQIDFWKILTSNSISALNFASNGMCQYGVYIDLTDDSHETIICVGVECDNLRRRGMRCSVKSDTKRIWTPYQEISCGAELYHEFVFVVNLRYSANAFWKICVGESKKNAFLNRLRYFFSNRKQTRTDMTPPW